MTNLRAFTYGIMAGIMIFVGSIAFVEYIGGVRITIIKAGMICDWS